MIVVSCSFGDNYVGSTRVFGDNHDGSTRVSFENYHNSFTIL